MFWCDWAIVGRGSNWTFMDRGVVDDLENYADFFLSLYCIGMVVSATLEWTVIENVGV